MKRLGYLMLMVGLLGSCQKPEKKGIEVSGELLFDNSDIEEVTLLPSNSEEPLATSALTSNNQFSMQAEDFDPGYYRLNFADYFQLWLILDESDIHVKVAGTKQQPVTEFTQSKTMMRLQNVERINRERQNMVQQLQQEFTQARKQGSSTEGFEARYQKMEAQSRADVKQIVREMEHPLAIVQAVNYLHKDKDFAFLDSIANNLTADTAQYQPVAAFVDDIGNYRSLAVGKVAPDISLPNPDGQAVKLSSLRGQYVLIDFWASWCQPCRQENPHVVKLYNQYHEQGFEIYGVSLDRSKDAWTTAIEKDGLEWIHVSDLEYYNSSAATKYQVQAIPYTVLLNPDGEIIAKNLRGAALDAKLKEIFGAV